MASIISFALGVLALSVACATETFGGSGAAGEAGGGTAANTDAAARSTGDSRVSDSGVGDSMVGDSGVDDSVFSYRKLVWADEFDGDALDAAKWRAMVGTGEQEGYPAQWGNAEAQYYRAENAAVRDGALVVTARKESGYGGMAYTSARLTTDGLYAFTYGRVEARMKLPAGETGLWPAFWLLPAGGSNGGKYGAWAASGELDVMESRSRVPGEVSGAAHYGGAWPVQTYSTETYTFPAGEGDAGAGGWHVYTLERFPDKLAWYVDGVKFFELDDWYTIVNGNLLEKPAPFDQPFCIILNMAVGGNFDGGALPGAGFADAEMLVDWVRVYSQ